MKSDTGSGRKVRLRAAILGCEPDDQDQISLLLELLGWRVDIDLPSVGAPAITPCVLFIGASSLENEAAVSTIKNTHATEMVVVYRGVRPLPDIQYFPFERTAYISSPLNIVKLERLIERFS